MDPIVVQLSFEDDRLAAVGAAVVTAFVTGSLTSSLASSASAPTIDATSAWRRSTQRSLGAVGDVIGLSREQESEVERVAEREPRQLVGSRKCV